MLMQSPELKKMARTLLRHSLGLDAALREQRLIRIFVTWRLRLAEVHSYLCLPEKGKTEALFCKTYLCQKVW